ncbi:MAG: SMP-30/gluconolactonase/LRE family protein [Kiritimatiellae bacterium]|nr:SMP-30/gluconolactonase/LRE family protein [Kiritimatiellia bacterium]
MITTTPNPFEIFADCRCLVGEGPLWNETDQALYWVDIVNGEIFRKRLDAATHDFERFRLEIGKIGGMVFTRDRALLLFAAQGRVWRWQPGATPVQQAELPAAAHTRFNDVIADPAGRICCGIAPAEKGDVGSLWRMETDGRFSCLEPATAGMPNGMGFSPDRKYFYFTVSNEKVIYRYDYVPDARPLANRVALIKVPENEGVPDGLTIDSEGCLWSAQWNGSRLVRYSPAGKKMQEYRFPIAKISCVTFGGLNFSNIFITTANHPWNETDYGKYRAGAVFRLKQSVRGLPEYFTQ